MAEAVGLAASVVGLASCAATVSLTLFECCHTMKHAHEQIKDIAVDVSLFADVLQHLSQVLEDPKGVIVDSSVRTINTIISVGEGIFNEIDMTIRIKRTKITRLTWLFEKTKYREIKAKMESLKSTLSVMLQTITLATIAQNATSHETQSSKRLKSQQHLNILKTAVLTNHLSIRKLQEVEQDMESGSHDRPGATDHRRKGLPPAMDPVEQPGNESIGPRLSIPSRSKPSDPVSKSSPDLTYGNEPITTGRDASSWERSASDELLTTMSHSTHLPRISDLLLSTLPYSLGMSVPTYSQSSYLSSSQNSLAPPDLDEIRHRREYGEHSRLGSLQHMSDKTDMKNSSNVEEEATASVRALLREWTNASPALVSALLDGENESSTNGRTEISESSFLPSPVLEAPRRQTDSDKIPVPEPNLASGTPRFYRPANSESRHLHDVTVEVPADSVQLKKPQVVFDQGRETVQKNQKPTPIHIKKAWEPTSLGDTPLVTVLADLGGKFIWMHHSAFETIFFVEGKECLHYKLLPDEEKRADEVLEVRTLVSKQWVLKEVIDAFNKSFVDHDAALYSIKGKLSYRLVKELHDVSSQVIEANIRTSSYKALEERRLARQQAQQTQTEGSEPTYVQALWDFVPRGPESLGFRQGDIITITEPVSGDWWKGTLGDQTGVFPSNYTEEIPEERVEEARKEGELRDQQRKRQEMMDWMIGQQRETWARRLKEDGEEKKKANLQSGGKHEKMTSPSSESAEDHAKSERESAIAQMEGMGISRSEIDRVMALADFDVQRAVDLLFKSDSGPNKQPHVANAPPTGISDETGSAGNNRKKRWYRR